MNPSRKRIFVRMRNSQVFLVLLVLSMSLSESRYCMGSESSAGAVVAAQPQLAKVYPAWIGALAYTQDGKFLAVGAADGIARVLHANDGREAAVLKGHTDAVVAVAFMPDGRQLITGSLDHTARIWEIDTAKPAISLDGHHGAVMSASVSPDGKAVATASIDTTIRLWDRATGKFRATLAGHKSWVNSVVFSADGQSLFSGSSDGTIKIWDVAAHSTKRTLQATTAEVRCVALSADGRILAAGLRYGWVKTWLAPDWKESLSFKGHDADIWALSFHPTNSALITGDGDWNRPGQVKFWNGITGVLLAQVPTSGEVLALACSPAGRQIAAGCWNKKLEVWDVPEAVASK